MLRRLPSRSLRFDLDIFEVETRGKEKDEGYELLLAHVLKEQVDRSRAKENRINATNVEGENRKNEKRRS